jgi:hypothetical protein
MAKNISTANRRRFLSTAMIGLASVAAVASANAFAGTPADDLAIAL